MLGEEGEPGASGKPLVARSDYYRPARARQLRTAAHRVDGPAHPTAVLGGVLSFLSLLFVAPLLTPGGATVLFVVVACGLLTLAAFLVQHVRALRASARALESEHRVRYGASEPTDAAPSAGPGPEGE